MKVRRREEEFYWEFATPKNIVPASSENKESSPEEIQTRTNFFGRDLLTILGQGPIKKNPIKRKDRDEEPLSPEMEAEIREIFGENSRPHNQKTE